MSAAPNLSLYSIELGLLELLQFREEVENSADMTPQEIGESLKAVDSSIEMYVTAELDKADGIAANLREFEMRAQTCKADVEASRRRQALWTARGERLEAVTLKAMQLAKRPRIGTARTTLKIAKNPASVEITDPALIPKPYMKQTVTINADIYDRLRAFLMTTKDGAPLFAELMAADVSSPDPMKTKIKSEIKAGVQVPGARLVDDKVRLVVE
jgi:hypothetical protein